MTSLYYNRHAMKAMNRPEAIHFYNGNYLLVTADGRCVIKHSLSEHGGRKTIALAVRSMNA